MRRAERVLEYSIRKHTAADLEFHWMRAGEGIWSRWSRQPAHPNTGRRGDWATPFTMFRYAIPIVSKKRWAIYLDADMLVLADIEELYSYRLEGRWSCVEHLRGDHVSVIDCESLRKDWPSIEELKRGRLDKWTLRDRARQAPVIPNRWSCDDIWREDAALIHYSIMRMQPWRPWPNHIEYITHNAPELPALWNHYEQELDSIDQHRA